MAPYEFTNLWREGGANATDGAPVLDASALFEMVFGSAKFESLLGELQLATIMKHVMDAAEASNNGEGNDPPSLLGLPGDDPNIQRKRQVTCALNIVKILDKYTSKLKSAPSVLERPTPGQADQKTQSGSDGMDTPAAAATASGETKDTVTAPSVNAANQTAAARSKVAEEFRVECLAMAAELGENEFGAALLGAMARVSTTHRRQSAAAATPAHRRSWGLCTRCSSCKRLLYSAIL